MSDAVDSLIQRFGIDSVVDALRERTSPERRDRIETVLDARLGSLAVAVEDLHDAHNGAAAIRSCEAVGLDAIHVVEKREEFRFSRKVSIGCEKWIQVHRYPTVVDCAAALRERGMVLYAAVPGAELSVHELDVSRPVALMFGNERDGLTEQAIAVCDHSFSIPMSGFSESLNLSVSVAVSVHGVAARRRAAIGKPGDLSDAERAYRRARWYALGIRGVDAIVERHVCKTTR